jgi:hypothetical protein
MRLRLAARPLSRGPGPRGGPEHGFQLPEQESPCLETDVEPVRKFGEALAVDGVAVHDPDTARMPEDGVQDTTEHEAKGVRAERVWSKKIVPSSYATSVALVVRTWVSRQRRPRTRRALSRAAPARAGSISIPTTRRTSQREKMASKRPLPQPMSNTTSSDRGCNSRASR